MDIKNTISLLEHKDNDLSLNLIKKYLKYLRDIEYCQEYIRLQSENLIKMDVFLNHPINKIRTDELLTKKIKNEIKKTNKLISKLNSIVDVSIERMREIEDLFARF